MLLFCVQFTAAEVGKLSSLQQELRVWLQVVVARVPHLGLTPSHICAGTAPIAGGTERMSPTSAPGLAGLAPAHVCAGTCR
jgi:hypothetical protein